MQRLRRSGDRGPSVVNRSQLLTIRGSLADMLNLRRNRRRAPLMQYRGFRRRGPLTDPAVPAVEAHVIGGRVIRDVAVINVVDDGRIHVRHRPVIKERPAVPVAAFVTAAGIAKAVIHTAVETDV